MHSLFLAAAGLLAGFIDSIAGGGGLITLPTLTLAVGAGPHAIGTNKIVGVTGALVALLVYLRGGHMRWGKSLAFTALVGVGSFCGSLTARLIPVAAFSWFLLLTCPLILWVVWRKDLWIAREADQGHITLNGRSRLLRLGDPKILLTGLACGFYDGVWGPGGGTFMFLGLLFVVRLPILAALAAAKFSNTVSASVALVTYAAGGYVHWLTGATVALGMAIGAFCGARLASRSTATIIRPVLVAVVTLLIVKTLMRS